MSLTNFGTTSAMDALFKICDGNTENIYHVINILYEEDCLKYLAGFSFVFITE